MWVAGSVERVECAVRSVLGSVLCVESVGCVVGKNVVCKVGRVVCEVGRVVCAGMCGTYDGKYRVVCGVKC